MTITTVLLDLDGVVRHFDPGHLTEVERRYDLDAGILGSTAFEPELINRLVTGQISRSTWTVEIGRRVGSPDAAAAWLAARGEVDEALMAEVRALRQRRVTVAILTNGTDTIPAELRELGVSHRVDAVFNSAEIGVAKPDPAVFLHVCTALGVEPSAVFFADDTPGHVDAAAALGLTARHYRGVEAFRADLAQLGLR